MRFEEKPGGDLRDVCSVVVVWTFATLLVAVGLYLLP
jgi:hypothetical protein